MKTRFAILSLTIASFTANATTVPYFPSASDLDRQGFACPPAVGTEGDGGEAAYRRSDLFELRIM